MDPTYPLNPIVQFICFFLVILPLASGLLKPWNTGICMYAIWVALSSLIRGTNAIIWFDNVNIIAPIWCDISMQCLLVLGYLSVHNELSLS